MSGLVVTSPLVHSELAMRHHVAVYLGEVHAGEQVLVQGEEDKEDQF